MLVKQSEFGSINSGGSIGLFGVMLAYKGAPLERERQSERETEREREGRKIESRFPSALSCLSSTFLTTTYSGSNISPKRKREFEMSTSSPPS